MARKIPANSQRKCTMAEVTKVPPIKKRRYTIQQVGEALRARRGMVTATARYLGCTSKCIYDYLKRSAELRALLEECREYCLDRAELGLFAAVDRGEPWAICFLLKCKAKSRGYVERQEVTGAAGGPVEVALTVDQAIRLLRQPEESEQAELEPDGPLQNGSGSFGL